MQNVLVHITKKSSNVKVAPLPVTTSERKTCPTTCPFYDKGCYAKSGPLAIHWKKVSNNTQANTTDWQGLCKFVESLPAKQLWRHNQAGDLPSTNGLIDGGLMLDLMKANQASKARGWTYTHHSLNRDNVMLLRAVNLGGFTVNASTESLEDADKAMAQKLPTVVVVPNDKPLPKNTPDGHKVVLCPAQVEGKSVTCSQCGLCSQSKRKCVVAFMAHGNAAKHINQLLEA